MSGQAQRSVAPNPTEAAASAAAPAPCTPPAWSFAGLEPGHERVERAIEEFRKGRMVILVDDEDRENEGDLCMAAEKVTPEAINFMARFGRGLICLALNEERCDKLGLRPMVAENSSPYGTAFTISIEARNGVTTGISAFDRAHTIKTALRADVTPYDLVRPGHVFPLRARPGGVLQRAGQTEGSVDLARLAGQEPAAVICEIMNDDGSMARMPDLEVFARQHDLLIVTIAELIDYRLKRESLVERLEEATLPVQLGGTQLELKARVYGSPVAQGQYLALVHGDLRPDEPTLVRVHTACLPGDILGSLACDCGAQLAAAARAIAAAGKGVILYLRPAGSSWQSELSAHGNAHGPKGRPLDPPPAASPPEGAGVAAAAAAVGGSAAAQPAAKRPGSENHKKDPASLRDYGIGAQVLADVGVRKMRLMTNNPKKIIGLGAYGLEVVERVPLELPTAQNLSLLIHKRESEGHLFDERLLPERHDK